MTLAMLIHLGGGYPISGLGVPHLRSRGVPHLRSGVGGYPISGLGGTLSKVWRVHCPRSGGYPIPGPGGYPIPCPWGGGTPGIPQFIQTWDGVPPFQTWDGVPPIHTWDWVYPRATPGMGFPPT